MNIRSIIILLLAAGGLVRADDSAPTRDLTYFLHNLRTADALPEIEDSHTALSSTWDRTGGNGDGGDFKRIEGTRNILLDVDGPGCIHRIFTGELGDKVAGTRIRIFLDRATKPVFDLDVNAFFDPDKGPLPYPLVFHKTYPGTLFPIPFAHHCLVEIDNPDRKNWGDYWQVAYTTYPLGTHVASLHWPLDAGEKAELKKVCAAWLYAEASDPPPPAVWSRDEKLTIEPGATAQCDLAGCGVIREMRIAANPGTPDALRSVRMKIAWDGSSTASVDVPIGYFFGDGEYGYADAQARFSSLLMGSNATEAYTRFPMPFAKGADLTFRNEGTQKVALELKLDVEKLDALPPRWGRFHATWSQEYVQAPYDAQPKTGPQHVPVHVTLERNDGPGKYVGVLLYVHWPNPDWWGEGDWQIWSDENGWPPSYHGTGSEEYFNSGWCNFDRKAVSGFVRQNIPGNVTVYSFHLNDAFDFQKNIRVCEEIWPWHPPKTPAIWTTTALWYALAPQDAHSRQDLLPTQTW